MIALENAIFRAIGIVDIAVRCLIVSACISLTHHHERRSRSFFFLPTSHSIHVNDLLSNSRSDPDGPSWPALHCVGLRAYLYVDRSRSSQVRRSFACNIESWIDSSGFTLDTSMLESLRRLTGSCSWLS